MRYHEIITEGRDAFLYHGYPGSKLKHASRALATGQMAGTSTQRFWADGRRRTEDEVDYKESYWMKGLSLTRDIAYAMAWGDIVIAINQAKLIQRTKVIPYSWGYHMAGNGNKNNIQTKREREEFAVTKRTPDDYHFPPGHEREGEFDHNRFQSNDDQIEGFIPLAPILEGIWMHYEIASLHQPGPQEYNPETGTRESKGMIEKEYYQAPEMAAAGYSIQDFIDHSKFKGYFSGGRRGDPPGYKLIPKSTPRIDLPPRGW
jgi:hypothetical protein